MVDIQLFQHLKHHLDPHSAVDIRLKFIHFLQPFTLPEQEESFQKRVEEYLDRIVRYLPCPDDVVEISLLDD